MSDRRRPKSPSVQFVLTLLLGPLGLLYSSAAAAVLVSLAAIVIAYDTEGRNVVIGWPLAIVTGYFTVRRWNHRALGRERLAEASGGPPVRRLPSGSHDVT